MQHYADRGVFRGLSIDHGRAGALRFKFTWLTRRPTIVTYDPKTGSFAFQDLLPAVGKDPRLLTELKALVDTHATASVPPSRRIDARRVRVRSRLRAGHLSLSLTVCGSHHRYAVQRGLNLVNQLFLHLHAYYPEYLVERFGFSSE